MADINRLRRKTIPTKQFALKAAEIIDFTESQNPTVFMVNYREVNTSTTKSAAKELVDKTKSSPWTEDRSAEQFATASQSREASKDPVKELQAFVNALSQGNK